MAATKISPLISVLARCMPSDVKNAAKFQVKLMEFDTNLNMHFSKHETVYAHDPASKCKPGDVVLIERLPSKLTKNITHVVNSVVYPFGDITDPITGKKVVVGKYRDEIEAKSTLYGKNPEGFEYDVAPERGWQKDKRDFTYQETYRKYHVFEHDEPYAV
uniref:EOG090X0GMQ n=1 Tax=Alona affinis TaxID=381656 RepID=A0A9N6ZG70_9CRUS|nr:EOG090X0GMQ [Alona affinis]